MERTEGALPRALIELILDQGFEATTISQIAERANVGRSTADEVAVQAIAGGFGWVIHWWMLKAPELGPLEVDRHFRALMEPVLRGADQPRAP